ncbi:hypothetical protein WH47_02649 [Habropoda laboriosa]|uniref:Uncharacterized protein n=1 Tax=Habropoda laboriosa TaxID=597456 RepID=A0A0L7QX20_9HYME|nr:hypothetical protein WH47_02649 [Habropoda laboriosa]
MEHSVYLFSLILLLKVPQQLECSVLETRILSTLSTTSNVSNVNTNINNSQLVKSYNEKIYDTSKHESSLMNSKAKTTSESLISESLKMNSKSSIDEELEDTTESPKNGIDEEDSQQIIRILKKSIQNSVPEHWNRVRRDDEEGTKDTEPSNSDEPPEPSGSSQGIIMEDSSQNNDGETIEEETEDASNTQSNEESSQLDPVEISSMDMEVREERSAKLSKETLEKSEDRNRLYSNWYHEPSFDKRYWSSYERQSHHKFIKIPIFPGK